MFTRLMQWMEVFFFNGDGWTITHYGLILAFFLMVFALVAVLYGTIRHSMYKLSRWHQLHEWRKARENAESGAL